MSIIERRYNHGRGVQEEEDDQVWQFEASVELVGDHPGEAWHAPAHSRPCGLGHCREAGHGGLWMGQDTSISIKGQLII